MVHTNLLLAGSESRLDEQVAREELDRNARAMLTSLNGYAAAVLRGKDPMWRMTEEARNNELTEVKRRFLQDLADTI